MTHGKTSERRPARRRRAAHLGPERRRPLVLDAALRLFVERGYETTTVEEIAEAAGISRPVVYDCYPNKEALFAALLEREQKRLAEHLLASVPPDPTFDNPAELLRAGFTGFLSAAASAPDSWRLVYASDVAQTPQIVARVDAGRRMVRKLIGDLAAETLAAQRIEDRDGRISRVVAYLIVGQAEAGVRLMVDHPGEWHADELGALIARMTTPALNVLRSSGIAS